MSRLFRTAGNVSLGYAAGYLSIRTGWLEPSWGLVIFHGAAWLVLLGIAEATNGDR